MNSKKLKEAMKRGKEYVFASSINQAVQSRYGTLDVVVHLLDCQPEELIRDCYIYTRLRPIRNKDDTVAPPFLYNLEECRFDEKLFATVETVGSKWITVSWDDWTRRTRRYRFEVAKCKHMLMYHFEYRNWKGKMVPAKWKLIGGE
jgi:hypothetical protein